MLAPSKVAQFLGTTPVTPIQLSTQQKLRDSIEIISDALLRFTPDEIAISYNGGKDCLVMLVIYIYVLSTFQLPTDHLKAVFVHYEEQFPELLEFISKSSKDYNLSLMSIKAPLKSGLFTYVDEHPEVKAVIIGTRRSDPFAADLKPLQPTDHSWPDLTRIHPILEWHYDEVWAFLKTLDVEYCKLYDMGYTSIGGIDTTVRNPKLETTNGEFLPAFHLHGDEFEREGRQKKGKY